MVQLELRNVTKSYGSKIALQSVSTTLNNGIYGLLGPNGAGKSTLINLLTDNLKRETGDILYNETDILKLGKKYRNELGYMPQQQGFYEDFSASAFLMYMAQLKGMKKSEAKKRVNELLQVVNMEEHCYQKMGSFSGGMRQRVLLAQALLNDPKILILDEPTAGVDPEERIRIRNFISEIARDRIVLVATHIVSDIESIAKEILLLKSGQLLQKDTPSSFIDGIKDKVYEIEVEEGQLSEIQKKYIVSGIRHSGGKLLVKIITKEPPEEGAYSLTPVNLEDVYLYYFKNDATTF